MAGGHVGGYMSRALRSEVRTCELGQDMVQDSDVEIYKRIDCSRIECRELENRLIGALL